jgi:myxalamid-type polyketide synthase MxaE and MxaD
MSGIGIGQITAEQGTAILDRLLGQRDGYVVAAPMDWNLVSASPALRNTSLTQGMVSGATSSTTTAAPLKGDVAPDPADRKRAVTAMVREAVGRVLRIAPARIDPRKPLGSMGLTSIMAVELRNVLERAEGRALSATLAWNYPTVDALVAYLTDDGRAAGVAVPTASAMSETVRDVREMADEDAARLLRRKR